MNRQTILKLTGCDVKRLPLGAREAFFLSQLDGRLTVEEIAEVAGVALDEALRLAKRLVELGAVAMLESRRPPSMGRGAKRAHAAIEAEPRAGRVDPRAERDSIRPQARKRSLAPPRLDKRSLRPAAPSSPPGRRPTPRPERRSSRKSLREQRAVSESAAPGTPPDLDASPPKQATMAPERRRSSRAMKALSRSKLAAAPGVSLVIATGAEPQVTAVIAKRRSSKALPVTESRRPSLKSMRPPARTDATTDSGHPDRTQRMRQLRAAALEIKVQANIELLVKAAEDALRANDVVGAANNLRLALSHREDPHLRKKYEEIDARARVVRFEKNMAPARAAERDERWADAAVFLLRAHEARPDADVAARAANALRLSGGDLERAIALAGQAVAFDARNVAYQLTLGEVYLAASRFASAEETSTIVQELAPKDPRGRELAAEIARKRRPASKR